jgi:metal-responsive CopG/Arc/MetJ family transcriptional regulator
VALKTISLQLDEALLKRLDEVRGGVPRQKWVAWAIEALLRREDDK